MSKISSPTKSVGPRIKKWRAEFESQRKALRKLAPNTDAFRDAVSRLYDLQGRIRGMDNLEAMERDITNVVAPSLPAKAAELERLANTKEHRLLSISTSCTPTKKGWTADAYVSVYPSSKRLDGVTADTLPSSLASLLRRDAETLAMLADAVEKV